MNPEGIDSIARMQRFAGRLNALDGRAKIASAFDDVEHLIDALDPAMHGPACQLAESLQKKLARATT